MPGHRSWRWACQAGEAGERPFPVSALYWSSANRRWYEYPCVGLALTVPALTPDGKPKPGGRVFVSYYDQHKLKVGGS